MRFGKVPLFQPRGSWLYAKEIFGFNPMGLAIARGDTYLLYLQEKWYLAEEGAKSMRRAGRVSPCSITGLIPGTEIHGVGAQCIVQPSASSPHPSTPAMFIALFCLFMIIITYLCTC